MRGNTQKTLPLRPIECTEVVDAYLEELRSQYVEVQETRRSHGGPVSCPIPHQHGGYWYLHTNINAVMHVKDHTLAELELYLSGGPL